MRDVLRLVPLIGYWVEIEHPDGKVWAGVVDAVTTCAGGGVHLYLVGIDIPVDIADPDEWIIDVYRRAPNAG